MWTRRAHEGKFKGKVGKPLDRFESIDETTSTYVCRVQKRFKLYSSFMSVMPCAHTDNRCYNLCYISKLLHDLLDLTQIHVHKICHKISY